MSFCENVLSNLYMNGKEVFFQGRRRPTSLPRTGWGPQVGLSLGKVDGVESDSQINRKGFPSEEPSSRGSPETLGNLGMGIMPSQSTPDTFSYPPLPSLIHQADVGLPNTAK